MCAQFSVTTLRVLPCLFAAHLAAPHGSVSLGMRRQPASATGEHGAQPPAGRETLGVSLAQLGVEVLGLVTFGERWDVVRWSRRANRSKAAISIKHLRPMRRTGSSLRAMLTLLLVSAHAPRHLGFLLASH